MTVRRPRRKGRSFTRAHPPLSFLHPPVSSRSLPPAVLTMLGSIIERSAPSSSSAPVSFIPSPPSASGFPKAQHRSAFKKSLARPAQPRTAAPPSLGPTPAQATQTAQQFDNDDDHLDETAKILRSVQRENEDKLASMSSEEIQQKKEELLERFGGGLLDQFRKRREQRQRSSEQGESTAKARARGKETRMLSFASLSLYLSPFSRPSSLQPRRPLLLKHLPRLFLHPPSSRTRPRASSSRSRRKTTNASWQCPTRNAWQKSRSCSTSLEEDFWEC